MEKPYITQEFIEKHIDKFKSFRSLNENPFITIEFIEKHINKIWGFTTFIEKGPCITQKFNEKYILDNLWYCKIIKS